MAHPSAERFWPPGLAEDAEVHCLAAGCTVPQTGFTVRGRNLVDCEGAANSRHRGAEFGKVRGLIFKEYPLDFGVQNRSIEGLQAPHRDVRHQNGRSVRVKMRKRREAEKRAQDAVSLARSRIADLRYQLDPGVQTALDDDVIMITGAVAMAHHDPGHGLRRQAAQVQIGRQNAAGHVVIGIASDRKRACQMQVFRVARQCFEEPACSRERTRRKRAGDQVHAVAAHVP